MKTPWDKILDGRNDIVQIVVAPHACDIALCSNCTQLIPYRKDKRFMSPEVFREAVRSLEGYPGVRALFGGNPCSSPHFVEYCAIMREEVPDQKQRGLWSNNLMTKEKAEAARKAFYPLGRHNLNVHGDAKAAKMFREYFPEWRILGESRLSWHSPILMHYEDFGIPYENWRVMRESCDINRNWSAAIVERDFDGEPGPGVYFCEVASALDGVRGTNHAILAEPGWWKWPISRFREQVSGCCDAGCGVPLRRKGHLDRDFTYDYSPRWEKIATGRKLVKLKTERHEAMPDGTQMATDYQRLWTR